MAFKSLLLKKINLNDYVDARVPLGKQSRWLHERPPELAAIANGQI
jgi:hypothetical protein